MKIINNILLGFVLLLSAHASAHQQKEAYTSVIVNPRSGMLEIQHRFYLHDAEHAAQRILGNSTDLLSDPVGREAFAYYAIGSFALKDAQKHELALSYVGNEIEGKYLWVYQETPLSGTMDSFYIKMTALQELWPGQTNHINIERREADDKLHVSSARLQMQSDWQLVSFEQ